MYLLWDNLYITLAPLKLNLQTSISPPLCFQPRCRPPFSNNNRAINLHNPNLTMDTALIRQSSEFNLYTPHRRPKMSKARLIRGIPPVIMQMSLRNRSKSARCPQSVDDMTSKSGT